MHVHAATFPPLCVITWPRQLPEVMAESYQVWKLRIFFLEHVAYSCRIIFLSIGK